MTRLLFAFAVADAEDAIAADDDQWAAQLADYLLAINKGNAEASHI